MGEVKAVVSVAAAATEGSAVATEVAVAACSGERQ